MNLVGVDQSAFLIGQVALVDLDAGTLDTPELFAPGGSIANGSGIVGIGTITEHPRVDARALH